MTQHVSPDHKPEKVFVNLYGTLIRPQMIQLLWLTEEQYSARDGDLLRPGDGVILLSSFRSHPGSKLVFQAGIVIHEPVEVAPQWSFNAESSEKPETRVVPIVGPWFDEPSLSNSAAWARIYGAGSASNFRAGLTLPGGKDGLSSAAQSAAKKLFSELLDDPKARWRHTDP